MNNDLKGYQVANWSDYLDEVLKEIRDAYRQPNRNKQLIVSLNEELYLFGVAWTPEMGLVTLINEGQP